MCGEHTHIAPISWLYAAPSSRQHARTTHAVVCSRVMQDQNENKNKSDRTSRFRWQRLRRQRLYMIIWPRSVTKTAYIYPCILQDEDECFDRGRTLLILYPSSAARNAARAALSIVRRKWKTITHCNERTMCRAFNYIHFDGAIGATVADAHNAFSPI